MNMFKEVCYLITEIVFAIFIIIFGYFIWDNFDQTDYNTAKYYDNTKEVDLVYESNIDNGIINNNTVVSIHNISNKLNNKDVILKINKDNNLDNLKIDVNKEEKSLNDLYISNDDVYNYYLIENTNLKGYETKVYFIDFKLSNNNLLNDYEFITEI